jgi:hypothetical protein
MTRALILLSLLAGCSTAVPPVFPPCPDPGPKPAALRKHEPVGALEIRVELAREAAVRRADACAAAVQARDEWIEGRKK